MRDIQDVYPIQSLALRLEISSERSFITEIAADEKLGRIITEELTTHKLEDLSTNNRCDIIPASTGKMGGGPVYDIIVSAYHLVRDNETLLAVLLAPFITDKLIPIISKYKKEYSVRIQIPTLNPDKPIIIETSDPEVIKQLLEQLAKNSQDVKSLHLQKRIDVTVRPSSSGKKPRARH